MTESSRPLRPGAFLCSESIRLAGGCVFSLEKCA